MLAPTERILRRLPTVYQMVIGMAFDVPPKAMRPQWHMASVNRLIRGL